MQNNPVENHTLIAYYSMTGHTRDIATELRRATGADIEEIAEPKPRHGFTGVVRALIDSIARRTPPIVTAHRDPANYDLLLIGGPVWAGRMAAPVRTYAERYGVKAPRVAFFCTEGGSGAEKAFADLEQLCQHRPEATLVIDAAHLPAVEHHAALGQFTQTLSTTRH